MKYRIIITSNSKLVIFKMFINVTEVIFVIFHFLSSSFIFVYLLYNIYYLYIIYLSIIYLYIIFYINVRENMLYNQISPVQ